MLALFRSTLVFLWLGVCAIVGSLYSLRHFRDPSNLHVVAQIFSKYACPMLGLNVIKRNYEKLLGDDSYVILANHQHILDVPLFAGMVPPRTLTIAKKEVLWIPFFGLIFFAAGNITIDRKNLEQAKESLDGAGRSIRERKARIWLFPEGTRRYGLTLGPFKKGPFHLALNSGVALQPIVSSSLKGAVDLNRKKTGTVILEALDPIETAGRPIEDLMEEAHAKMKAAIARLDHEIQRNG